MSLAERVTEEWNRRHPQLEGENMKHITYLESVGIHERINKTNINVYYKIPDDPEKHEQVLIKWAEEHPVKTNLDMRKEQIAKMSAQNYATFIEIGGSVNDYDTDVNWLNAPADEI
jgi:hypothetical protein